MNLNNKAEVVFHFLQLGESHLLVDTTLPGVVVPENLLGAQVILKFSRAYNTQPTVTADALEQVLTFNGQPFAVRVPWHAVCAVGNPAFALSWKPAVEAEPPAVPAPQRKQRPSHLQLVH